tara:strand:+ start:152 stop:466 length:315 start_codon:yes stop_codon:yes gene_type:complete
MSELLEALKGLPPLKKKKHFVTIEGKQYQVGLQKKLEIMRNGEENYMIKPAKFGPEILLKPKPKAKTRHPVLKNAVKGYSFEQGDIHWPNGIVKDGEAWLIEYE